MPATRDKARQRPKADYGTKAVRVIPPLQLSSGGSFEIYWFVIMMAAIPTLAEREYGAE